MYAKVNPNKQSEISSDFKDVEKNSKKFKKNKTDHPNHPKKIIPLTDRSQGTNFITK